MSEGFESLLSSVLGNEELMSKISSIAGTHGQNQDEALPEVIEAIASSIPSQGKGNEVDKENVEASVKESFEPAFKDFKASSNSTRLLQALRPYLSEKRAHIIDSILRAEQIAELMRLTR